MKRFSFQCIIYKCEDKTSGAADWPSKIARCNMLANKYSNVTRAHSIFAKDTCSLFLRALIVSRSAIGAGVILPGASMKRVSHVVSIFFVIFQTDNRTEDYSRL